MLKNRKMRQSNSFIYLFFIVIIIFTFNSCGYIMSLCFMGSFTNNGIELLKVYEYNGKSKKDVNNAVKYLFIKYSEYIPTKNYEQSMIHNYMDLSSIESRAWNADSVNFHFVLKNEEGKEIFYWTRFGGLQDNWLNDSCFLVLKSYQIEKKEVIIKKDMDFKNDIYIKLFEKEILTKVQYFLDKAPN